MIIACPACATRYVVPDSAIGVDGRTVRCAKCRHDWFQEGPAFTAPPPPPPAPPPAPPQPQTWVEDEIQDNSTNWTWHEAPDRGPDSSGLDTAAPEADTSAPAPAADEVPVPPVYADAGYQQGYADYEDTSRFDHQPLLAPRRNPARMWTIAASLFAVVSVAAIGATAWYGLPDWMPFAKPTFAQGQPGLKLDFPRDQQDRYALPDGTWFFGANGTVTNTSAQSRSVPGILIILRDSRGIIVHTAEVRSPKRVLGPGESVDIREALVPVPRSGVRAEFGWKPS